MRSALPSKQAAYSPRLTKSPAWNTKPEEIPGTDRLLPCPAPVLNLPCPSTSSIRNKSARLSIRKCSCKAIGTASAPNRAPPEYHRLVVTRAVFWSAHTPRQLCALRTQDTRATEGACHCRVIPLSYPTSKRKVPCIAGLPCSPMRLAWGERGDASNRVMLARHV